jgi:hypothetical protein
MFPETPLITTIVAGLGLAFVFGAIAQRLRVSPLVRYLLAGVAVGPFTPGFVADPALAAELAEIGVILLMTNLSARIFGEQVGQVNPVKGMDRSGELTPLPRPSIVRVLCDALPDRRV